MKLSLAHTRLRKEIKEYEKLQEKDRIRLILPEKENIFQWQAILRGPPDTPYEGGIFKINIKVPDNYPISPPKCVFITKIFHPNIDNNENNLDNNEEKNKKKIVEAKKKNIKKKLMKLKN